MTPDFALEIGRETLLTAAIVAAPLIGLAVLVGLVIALLQALTQVHEMALTFAPKLLALVVGLIFLSDWMLQRLIAFAQFMFRELPMVVG